MRPPRILVASVVLAACGGTPSAASTTPDVQPDRDERPDAGLGLPNEASPLDGVITGGRPTAEALRAAAERGVRTVVDLRDADEEGVAEEAALVAELGMTLVSIPVAGAEGLTVEAATRLDAALAAEGALPAVVHCASGNRAGALLALRAFHRQGMAAEEAIALGRAAGLRGLEDAVREHMARFCAGAPDAPQCG